MSLQYIRERYGVPVKRGARAVVDGKPGRVTSARGGYIYVCFDGNTFSLPCHPTWRFEVKP